MKKTLSLIAGIVILGISSCQKREIIEQHNHYTIPNKTIYAERSGTQWILSNDGKTYETSIPFFVTDNFYNDYDGILVYISYDNVVWEQIPHTYLGIAFSYDTTDEDMIVRMQYPDHTEVTQNPGRVYFKIILIPSQE